MPEAPQGLITSLLGRFASRLRFPQLFAFTATIFVLDLLIPDLIPLVDELLLGLATVALGTMRAREPEVGKPPVKDVTPRDQRP